MGIISTLLFLTSLLFSSLAITFFQKVEKVDNRWEILMNQNLSEEDEQELATLTMESRRLRSIYSDHIFVVKMSFFWGLIVSPVSRMKKKNKEETDDITV